MKFQLEIDCDNAAFDPPEAEVAAILIGLAAEVRHVALIGERMITTDLRDTNGNTVGRARFVSTPNN